jgi:CRISPR type III-A-associated RAMP protein Csm5
MKATLTTLTPVHIGNGVTYNKGIDFIQIGDRIAIVDEKKVLDVIGKENISQWVAVIEKFNPETDFKKQPLLDLLENRGKSINDLTLISSRICQLKSKNNSSSQLKEQHRSPMKGMEIPGSSLKGAIKTGVLDHLVEEKYYDFSVSDIKFEREDRRTGQKRVDWKFDTVDRKIFGNTANEKSTRFIQVGDIYFPEIASQVHEIRILNIEGDEWRFKGGQHFLIEAIPTGVSSGFHLKLDHLLLESNIEKYPNLWPAMKISFLKDGIQGFCKIMNNVTASLVDWEMEVMENQPLNDEGEKMLDGYEAVQNEIEQLKQNEFILRIGANSGWIFMTAGWWRRFTDKFTTDEFSDIRKKIQKKNYHDMDLWPKTRKISSSGQIFGFVKVSLFPE